MIKNYEYLLFRRFFFSRKNEGYISIISWFSLIGISLGVAVLIIVMSVMNGFRDELIERIVGINGHINIFSNNNIINDKEIKLLKENFYSKNYIFNSTIITQGLVISNNSSRGVYLKSLKDSELSDNNNFFTNMKIGRIFNNSSNEAIIGNNLSKKLGVTLNDDIKIAIPKSDSTIFGNIPRYKTLKIVGIFELGMYEYDSNFIFVPLNIGRALLLLDDKQFNKVEIFLDNPENIDEFSKLFTNELLNNNLSNLYISSWKDNNKSFLDALRIERNVMFLILVLIILIASLNIISGLVIFVKDKNKDIGILRTLGMSKFSLLKIFLLIGFTIGLIGTISGLILGLIFCININKIQIFLEKIFNIDLFSSEIYFLSSLPARIDYYEIIFICLISLLISLLASIYPAIKSSRINPIKIIRNE